jgi:acetolactate synthase small subunit
MGMHIQVRASTKTSTFADEFEERGVAVSATYGLGVLSEMLGILKDEGFNLRTASGSKIELGGEFAFWVDARKDKDANHDEATRRAAEALGAVFDVHIVEVHRTLLEDKSGALKAFVDEVTAAGFLIEEISVGTPEPPDGRIPVQAFTVQAGRAASRS